jgi:hypothetical protein
VSYLLPVYGLTLDDFVIFIPILSTKWQDAMFQQASGHARHLLLE